MYEGGKQGNKLKALVTIRSRQGGSLQKGSNGREDGIHLGYRYIF